MFCLNLRGQSPTVNRIPFQYNQFFQSYTLLNPASAGHEAKIEVFGGYSGFTGIRKTLYDIFVTASVRLNEDSSKKHVLGVSIQNDIDGKYLSSNRFYVNYGYHLPLSEDYTISAGASLGFFNSTIKVNEFTGGGSDIALDAKLGLWIYNHTFGTGVSYGQFLNAEVRPIVEASKLSNFWNICGYKKISINQDWRIRGDVLMRFAKSFESKYNLALSVNYINRITAGSNYKIGEGVIIFAGLDSYANEKQNVSVLFSYNMSLRANNINNSNKYEITFSYYFDKN